MSAPVGVTPTRSAIERSLHDIVLLAARTVEGASAVGITVVGRDGALETPAYTDESAVRVDRAQTLCREGPCLVVGAPHEPAIFRIDDMASERRWPRFAAAAVRLGVRSMISCSLPLVHGGRRAALNLHATSPSAFDENAAATAVLCAAHSCLAFEQTHLISSLRSALASRQVIGEATGVLMERHRVDSQAAFQMLVDSSQQLNVKVREIARCVVRTGQDPQAIGLEDLLRSS